MLAWRGNRCLFQEYNPHTMSEDEVKLLNIKPLRRNDTGAYLCRVLNEYGFTDLIHHLTVLPGRRAPSYYCSLPEKKHSISLESERPSLLRTTSATKYYYLSSRLPDKLILTIAGVIGIMLLAFIFFLIYHFRQEKSLRQTLLATRILATRGISNLKSVSNSWGRSFSRLTTVLFACRAESALPQWYWPENETPSDRWDSSTFSHRWNNLHAHLFLLWWSMWTTSRKVSEILSRCLALICLLHSLLVGHLIGKGAFGFVYQGVAKGLEGKGKSTTVAIKTVRGESLVSRSRPKTISAWYRSRRCVRGRDWEFTQGIIRDENGRQTYQHHLITRLLYERRSVRLFTQLARTSALNRSSDVDCRVC